MRDSLGGGAGQGIGSLSFDQRCLGIFLSRPRHRAGIWETVYEWSFAQLGRSHLSSTDLKPSFFFFFFSKSNTGGNQDFKTKAKLTASRLGWESMKSKKKKKKRRGGGEKTGKPTGGKE